MLQTGIGLPESGSSFLGKNCKVYFYMVQTWQIFFLNDETGQVLNCLHFEYKPYNKEF